MARLGYAAYLLSTIGQYRYVPESGLRLPTILGAARLAARTLLACDVGVAQELREKLEKMGTVARTEDGYEELKALCDVQETLRGTSSPEKGGYTDTVRRLIEVAWGYVFMHYFWLQQSRSSS